MSPGYDQDFVEWAHHSAALLRSGKLDMLDIEHVAEEVEDLGKRHRFHSESRLTVLLKHLAKWQMQPDRREKSTWRSTIKTQRIHLHSLLAKYPSLRRYLREELQAVYTSGLELALHETRLPTHALPANCPFTLEQLLDLEFLPD